jgi:hypothetical protein
VAVGGTLDSPTVLERRRIVLVNPEMPMAKQPYHAAAEMPLAQAEALVNAAIETSRALAHEAISAIVKTLRSQAHDVIGCGILRGSGKELPELTKILAAHPLIHSAEGEMFRDVLVWAAQAHGLRVSEVREKGIDAASLNCISGLGKVLGPPWTQDQKFATVAALLALSSNPG